MFSGGWVEVARRCQRRDYLLCSFKRIRTGRMSMKCRVVFPFVDVLIVNIMLTTVYGWLVPFSFSCITDDRRSYLIDSLVFSLDDWLVSQYFTLCFYHRNPNWWSTKFKPAPSREVSQTIKNFSSSSLAWGQILSCINSQSQILAYCFFP